MTHNLQLQWPSTATDLSELVHRLLKVATEVQFVEIGLDGDHVAKIDAAKDAVRDIEQALEDAMETDVQDEQEAIARRLMGLLRSLRDDGLELTASVDQRTVEGAAGVGRLDVLSIVIDRQPVHLDQAAAPTRPDFAQATS